MLLRRTLGLIIVGLVLLGSAPRRAAASDNNVLWDQLYHSATSASPRTELVPGQAFPFLAGASDGTIGADTAVTVSMLADNLDLSAANLRYWDGAEHWAALSHAGSVVAAFRGQPSRTYELWRGTIPAHAAGATIWYRLQALDGSAAAYLKAANAQLNPLGQAIRGSNTDPDDYSYTVGSAAPTPTSTPTVTSTPGATATPTATPTLTATPAPTGTACAAGDGQIRTAAVYHADAEPLRSPAGAIAMTGTATFSLQVCRGDVQSVTVLVWKTGDPLGSPSFSYAAQRSLAASKASDVWTASVPGPGTLIDQWYQFRVTDGATTGYYRPASGNFGAGVWASMLGNPSWKLGTSAGPAADIAEPSWNSRRGDLPDFPRPLPQRRPQQRQRRPARLRPHDLQWRAVHDHAAPDVDRAAQPAGLWRGLFRRRPPGHHRQNQRWVFQ